MDDENLERWESTEKSKMLTASDRRILIAHWFYKAFYKAVEGDAKRQAQASKYFEHSGRARCCDGRRLGRRRQDQVGERAQGLQAGPGRRCRRARRCRAGRVDVDNTFVTHYKLEVVTFEVTETAWPLAVRP